MKTRVWSVIGIFVSIVVGVVSNILHYTITDSILLAVSFSILVLVIDFYYRIVAKVEDITFGLYEIRNFFSDEYSKFISISKNIIHINKKENGLLNLILLEYLSDFENIISDLSQEEFEADLFSGNTFGQRMIQSCKKTFWATTYGDPSLWLSDFGNNYIKRNNDLANKGIDIRRIWIQPKSIIYKQEYKNVINSMKSHGIKFWWIDSNDKNIDKRLLNDFAIIDEEIIEETILDSNGKMRKEIISMNSNKVRSYKKNFKHLMEIGKSI